MKSIISCYDFISFDKRLASVGLENTAENRQKFRHMMFKTKGLGKNLGGVILEKETLYQKDASGKELKIFK